MSKPKKEPRWRRPDITANRLNRARLSRLADMIANGATFAQAGAALGVSMQRAQQLFKRIEREMEVEAQ